MLPSLCLMYVVYYISFGPPALKWIYLIVFLLHNKSQREKRIFHDVFLCQFIISPVIVKFTIPQCRPHIEFCVHNIIWLLSYHKEAEKQARSLLSSLGVHSATQSASQPSSMLRGCCSLACLHCTALPTCWCPEAELHSQWEYNHWKSKSRQSSTPSRSGWARCQTSKWTPSILTRRFWLPFTTGARSKNDCP